MPDKKHEITMGDLSDLKLMHDMGYKNYMLSDTISQRYFDEAVKAWEGFISVHNELCKRGENA